ncbi:MAG: aldo/keto reductase [Clostridia bacterium]|nr:aldo/keto reductase [Clostridia bacterium]
MNPYFPEIKKNFGFGCMRLPLHEDGEVDLAEFSRMIEAFFAAGFNYFDTAHGYLKGKSETALKACLTSRYPRESYLLANKLSSPYFEREEEIRPFFEMQCEACGVDYFDFYLMHAQNANNYKKYKACRAYEIARELKEEGRVRHVGLSFHDTAEVLDMILTENPFVEFVQIQFNYLDYESVGVQSRLCYEVCRKHGKPVIVMEPVKGGSLVNLPASAQSVLDALAGGSNASYAIRFAASFDGMMMVLSGMSNMEQMADNMSFMQDFKPLTEEERAALQTVCDRIREQHLIACTACRYCVEGCPKNILIPDLFSAVNLKKQGDANADEIYRGFVKDHGSASDCIRCGKCERICPQKLPVRTLLREVTKAFE